MDDTNASGTEAARFMMRCARKPAARAWRIQTATAIVSDPYHESVGHARPARMKTSASFCVEPPSLAGNCFQILHQPLKRGLIRVVVFPVAEVGDEVRHASIGVVPRERGS